MHLQDDNSSISYVLHTNRILLNEQKILRLYRVTTITQLYTLTSTAANKVFVSEQPQTPFSLCTALPDRHSCARSASLELWLSMSDTGPSTFIKHGRIMFIKEILEDKQLKEGDAIRVLGK